MSKTSTINCDLCGTVVASKDCHCIFSRFKTEKPYITVPYNYIGVEFVRGIAYDVNAKDDYQICNDCLDAIAATVKKTEVKGIENEY